MPRSPRLLLTTAIAVSAAISMPAVEAGPFSALYVFGDSLSDIGNDTIVTGGAIPISPPYQAGHFTNGPNYTDVLAQRLGLPLTPSLLGGTNYAYGGARSDYMNQLLQATAAQSYVQQIGSYTSSAAAADPNALYVLWIGANDLSDILTGSNPHGGANASLSNLLGDLSASISSLAALGAEHFLVPNLPDLGLIPEVRAAGAGAIAAASSLSITYNGLLNQLLDGIINTATNLDVVKFDAFALQHQLTANPGAFGLTNVQDACYLGQPFPTSAPPPCSTPETYLYWDTQHPSAAAHEIFGNLMANAVPEPNELLLVSTGLLMVLIRRSGRARADERASR